MLQSLIRKRLFINLLFGVSLFLLLLIGFISYRNTQTWIDNRDEVIAVRENILNYEKLLSALKDTETGQRGYILTSDSAFLQPYFISLDSIRAITARLQTYPDRDLLTQQTEERINALIRRRQAVLAASLERFVELKRSSPATASQQLSFGRGKVLMDSLRLEVKQLQAYKSQLLRLKMQELSGRSDTIMGAQISGTLAGVLLLIWAFVLLQREMKKRRQNLLELEASNNLLELRVQERTDELYAALEELNASNEELQAGNEQQAALLEQLDAVKQRLNVALKISHMGAWTWHLHSNHIEWDENLEAVYGLAPGEFERIYGSNLDGLKKLIHPEDLPGLLETVNESLRTQFPFQAEYRIVRPDGAIHWLLGQGTVINNEQNEPVSMTGIDMDITDRKLAEEKIREREERFRTMADTAPVLIWMSGTDGLCFYFNKPWLDFTGRTFEQEQGNGWVEGVHPDDRQRCLTIYQTAFSAREPFRMEYRLRQYNGTYCWITDHGVPRFTPDGTFEGYIGSGMNIHDRVEAEAKLRRLFESGLIGIIYYDFDGPIREANNLFLSITGYTQEDVAAGRLNWTTMTPPKYARKDKKYLQQLRDHGIFDVFEKEFYRKDGTSVPVLLGGATLEGHDNQGVAFVLDISERKEAEERVKKSERLLYEVFENSADALFLINTQGNIVERYNQQAVLLFGLEDTRKYVGLEVQNLQKYPFTEEESRQVIEQLTTHGFWSDELEYVTMQGKEFWGNAAVSLINVNDQQYYLIRIRDITDRRYFEERLQKSQRVLESIFEGVADALFVVDPATNLIVDCNQQVTQLFEFNSKEEVIGRNGNKMQKQPFTEEEIKRIGREIWANRYWSSEVEYITQMGRPFWGDIAITIIPFEDKEHLLVRVGDITDRKRYQEILHQNQQELLRQKQRTEEALAIIAEDNERKTQELEEAQALQLSMLPQALPAIPYLDVAMLMKTSVEVGGDYYDYKLHENGDITLVIGDATGHGLKAGIVVATVKSYFQTLAGQYEAIELLERISEGIQNLQIRGMYMGLTVMQFSCNQVVVASSGMPPLYVFRQATGQVETILLKGIFLGSRLEVPIEQTTLKLSSGDTILALSDGLPELFDAKREMLDYQNIERVFKAFGDQPGQQIIDRLMELGQQWNCGASNEDDITLLVIKAK